MVDLNLKKGDTRTAIKATLKNPKGLAVDLTDANVSFIMVKYKTILIDRGVEVIDASNGIVSVIFTETELSQVGRMKAEFKVKYPDNSVETFPNQGYIDVIIESDLRALGG